MVIIFSWHETPSDHILNQLISVMLCAILLSFVQFKKREKHPGRTVTFRKVAGLSPQLY